MARRGSGTPSPDWLLAWILLLCLREGFCGMLDVVFEFLRAEVDAYSVARLSTTRDENVELTAIADGQGKYALGEERVGLTLINIEEEKLATQTRPVIPVGSDRSVVQAPELAINAFALFCARFGSYSEALKRLALVMTFFQSRNRFDSQNSPGLDPRIGSFIVDLYTLSFEQQNYIWGTLGCGYLPSVAYRIRVLNLHEDRVVGEVPLVSTVHIEGHGTGGGP